MLNQRKAGFQDSLMQPSIEEGGPGTSRQFPSIIYSKRAASISGYTDNEDRKMMREVLEINEKQNNIMAKFMQPQSTRNKQMTTKFMTQRQPISLKKEDNRLFEAR